MLRNLLLSVSLAVCVPAALAGPALASPDGRRTETAAAQQTNVGTAQDAQVRGKAAATSDVTGQSYADREAAAKDLETFAGGDGTAIYLSSGAAAVVIVILVLLIVF